LAVYRAIVLASYIAIEGQPLPLAGHCILATLLQYYWPIAGCHYWLIHTH